IAGGRPRDREADSRRKCQQRTRFRSSLRNARPRESRRAPRSRQPLFFLRRQRLLALAAQHGVPAMYDFRVFTADGGLLSYGLSLADTFALVAAQVARILKGAKPADLPIQQPTKFELAINRKTARALGLEVPPTLLARADEVIE